MKYSFALGVLLFLSLLGVCQECKLTGTITDKFSGEGLVSANVTIGTNLGVVADLDGNYSITLPYGEYEVEYSFVGYVPETRKIKLDSPTETVNIKLTSIELDEAEVIADIAVDRETPVAFTNIDSKAVGEELASRDIPMLLNNIPGVYSTQTGGGDGDARITIRGFDQRNVAVLLDGIPVNDMENGWVYWSNWFGLDGVLQTIQVQRGLGVSKLAVPSVGGTINILTKGIDQKKQFKIRQEIATAGYARTIFGYNSGRLKGDWGITLGGSYKTGRGWVDGNWTNGVFYYAKIQKSVGNHVFTLNGFGAPQSHGQRSFRLGVRAYDHDLAGELNVDVEDTPEYGAVFNPHVGELTRYELSPSGEKMNERTETFNERVNYYHKPQFYFKHSWNISEKSNLNTVAYLSVGNGGGTRLEDGVGESERNPDGSIDFQSMYDYNTGYSFLVDPPIFVETDPSILPEISPTEHEAKDYIISSINNHVWYGLLSSYKRDLSEHFTLSGGIDIRHYTGEHYREVYDLLGADYVLDGENPNSSNPIKRKGDIIDYHNDAIVEWGGGFGQIEYKNTLWSAFFSGSYAMTRYQRIDYMLKKTANIDGQEIQLGYAYDFNVNPTQSLSDSAVVNGVTYTAASPELDFQRTDWYYSPGFTIKTGANRKLNEKHNIYTNLGYLDRSPRFRNVFDFGNDLWLDIQNERIKAVELGYGYSVPQFKLKLNSYYTVWENRPVNNGVSIPDPFDPEETINANINGMNARHMGVEVECAYKPIPELSIQGRLSLGDWIWTSQDTVYFAYDDGTPVVDLEEGERIFRAFDARGVHVGDAAQSSLSLMVRYEPIKHLYTTLNYTYFDRYYANFNPVTLNGDDEQRDSWRIPAYGMAAWHCGYSMKLNKDTKLGLRLSVLNAFDSRFISDAQNNDARAEFIGYQEGDPGFDGASAGVFIAQGRRFNLSATLSF